MKLNEILELLKDYGERINEDMVRFVIYDDESGGVFCGTEEDEAIFDFSTIEELIRGLQNTRTYNMSDLIIALKIFLKYGDTDYPLHSEHDTLYVNCNPNLLTVEDIKTVEELGFITCNDFGKPLFKSYKYGSF